MSLTRSNMLSSVRQLGVTVVTLSGIDPSAAFAADVTAKMKETGAVAPDMMSSIVQVSIGLGVILVLIFGLAWFARRFGAFPTGGGQTMKVLGAMSMGQRERVVLLQVGETQMVLGVAPGRVQMLHVLDKPIEVSTTAVQTREKGGFAEKLQTALNQRMQS